MPRDHTLAALQESLERLSARHFDLSQSEDGLSRSTVSDNRHAGISPWDSFTISFRAQTLLNVLSGFRDADSSPTEAVAKEPGADLRASSATRSMANDDCTIRPAVKEDPTLFSKLRQEYQNILEHFLQQDSANDPRLKDFQIRNNAGHFLCRFKGCPRASEGFDTLDLRQQHEDRHTPRFKCNEPSCRLICSNRSVWKRHMEKYHGNTKLSEIPSSLEVSTKRKEPHDMGYRNIALLEQQSEKRLLMAQQEQEEEEFNAKLSEISNGLSLSDYQRQLMMLELQCKKRRLLMDRLQLAEEIPDMEEGHVPLEAST